jgi:glycoside/pentoside/hexuronide:cation symporter, GPH family
MPSSQWPRGAERRMERLPIVDKLLYAVASIGNSALFWSQSALLLFFYAPPPEAGLPTRIPLALVGILLGIGKFIEVFDDPLIGWWSDRTRGRWGRRIPFLLLGTPVLGLSFWLIWTPPADSESVLNVIWFFVMVEIFFLARTIVEAPYDALQAELVKTSSERVSLGAWKVFFAVIGAVIGLVFSGTLADAFGFGGMGLILGLAAVGALYLMLFGLWGRGTLTPSTSVVDEPVPLFASLLGALRSRPFLALAASFMLFNLGYQMLVGVLSYYIVVIHGLRLGDLMWFTGGVTIFIVLALPALTFAAHRFSKRAIYAGSMAALGAYLVFLTLGAYEPFVPGVDFFIQALVLVSLTGLGFAALFLFPGAMVADLIDEDARRTGQGRAAIFYGMFKTLEKVAQAMSVVTLSAILALLGNSRDQPFGIVAVMPIAGAFVLAGALTVLLVYHVREARREPSAGDAHASAAS